MSKKIYLFALLLVMLLSVTCVAASEDVGTDDSAMASIEEVDVQSATSDDGLASSDTEILSDDKADPNLNVNVETENEFIKLTANVNETATGSVFIQIKEITDENYTDITDVDIEDGTAVWADMVPFDKGIYLANVTYLGDENFYSTSEVKEFEIKKSIPDFNVTITTDNEFVTIDAILNKDATGTVTFSLKTADEENFTEMATLELEDGMAIWSDMVPLNKGDYVAYTAYNGDENYFEKGSTQTFEIEKYIPDFNVTITTDNEFVTIEAKVDANATGNVTFRIKKAEEENYTEMATVEIEDGSAIWADMVPFDKGAYIAWTVYSGDENYFEEGDVQSFSIEKSIPDFNVNITTDNAFVAIEAKVNEDATGNVTFYIKTFDEENYTEMATIEIEDGSAIWADMIPFDKGEYVAYTVYSGDEKYFNKSSTQTFEIEKSMPDFNVTIITDNEFLTIEAKLNEDATGTVTFYLKTYDEENFTEMATDEIEDGKAVWGDMFPLNKGEYVAYAYYEGDDKYFKKGYTEPFEIEKEIADLNVTITTDDEFVTIKAKVNEDATGTVTFYIKTFDEENFTEMATVEIEDGEATWADMIPFDKGDYVAYTLYSGDDKYFKKGSTQTFEIEKEITDFNVTIITDNEFLTIEAKLNEDATGNVTFSLKTYDEENFTEMATVEIEDGKAVWGDMFPLNKGDYVAFTYYEGDDKYFKRGSVQTFKIEKEIADFNVTIITNNEFVTIEAKLNEDATGNVTFYIKTFEEENFTEMATLEIEDGEATWADMIPFDKGDYVAYTVYNGDDKYFKKSSTQTFEIEKSIPDFNMTITTDNEFVTIETKLNEDATGTVTFYLKTYDEENYTEMATIEIEDGEATWADMIPLNKGDYVAYTIYNGDDKYFKKGNTQTFEIEKEIADFNVTITTDNAFVTIEAIVNEDATGNVTFFIKTFEEENFTEMATLELEDGKAVWGDMIPFDKGDYVAYTVYNGDDKYFKKGNTQTFEIEKSIPDFNVTITTDNEFVIITANVNKNATGTVTFYVKRAEEENFTEMATVEIEDGEAVWADMVPFDKGEYVAYTLYSGDKNYFEIGDTQPFEIEKEIPDMYITQTVNGTVLTVSISLPDNATGIVIINNTKTGEIKEVAANATVTYSTELTAGNNVITIEYSGDDNYFPASTTINEIVKQATTISTKSKINVVYGNTAKVSVTLKAADGTKVNGETVYITVNKKTYKGTVKNGSVTISIAANLVPKSYTAKVSFEGSDYLKASSTKFTLAVKKATPKLTAKAKTFKVKTKIKKYTVTLKNNKGKVMKKVKLTLKVRGKTFKATTNAKGKATFKITNLKKKSKSIALVKYSGNKYYKAVSKKAKITVR